MRHPPGFCPTRRMWQHTAAALCGGRGFSSRQAAHPTTDPKRSHRSHHSSTLHPSMGCGPHAPPPGHSYSSSRFALTRPKTSNAAVPAWCCKSCAVLAPKNPTALEIPPSLLASHQHGTRSFIASQGELPHLHPQLLADHKAPRTSTTSTNFNEHPRTCKTSKNLHEHPRTSTTFRESLRTCTNLHKPPRTPTIHELPQTSTNLHETPRTSPNLHEHPRTSTNLHESARTPTNLHEP